VRHAGSYVLHRGSHGRTACLRFARGFSIVPLPLMSQATVVQSCAICGARFQVYATVREALCPTCGATNQIGARPVAQRAAAQPRRAVARPMAGGAARPVVVIKESGGSWLVLLMLAIMIGGGVAVWHFRERLWPAKEKKIVAPIEEPVFAPPADFDREYRLAQNKLMDGDKELAREAAKTFRELDGPSVLQPQRNWVTFQAGLANLIAGDTAAAAERWGKLAERAHASQDTGLTTFFARSAELGGTSEPIPAAEGATLNRKNYESMGLLLYGLKNWALGKTDEALALLTEFGKATPEGEHEWVADYQSLAVGLVSDREHWLAASKAFAEGKGAPEKLVASLETVRSARRQLRTKQFTEEVTQWETQLGDAVTAADAAKAKMLAEREAAEATGLVDLQKKTDELAKEFRFGEALTAANAATFSTEKRQAEHRLIQKRMTALVRFQRNLGSDLAAVGWREGVTRADGKVVPGDVRTVSETAIGTVPWKEVSLDWLTKVATAFIIATARLDYKSDRQFDLGVLLLLHGRTQEADALIAKAGDSKYEYLEAGMMLFTPPAESSSPPK
jgi:predicted RNA-binding Zn-ribbon protein involved in translation (DUF1610 family)